MSRLASGADRVVVRPVNNIYTALTGAAVLAVASAIIYVLFLNPGSHAMKLFGF
ncbi:MAG: hypothetical protein QM770_03560 [Tepidisphaeraceae bacterium]